MRGRAATFEMREGQHQLREPCVFETYWTLAAEDGLLLGVSESSIFTDGISSVLGAGEREGSSSLRLWL